VDRGVELEIVELNQRFGVVVDTREVRPVPDSRLGKPSGLATVVKTQLVSAHFKRLLLVENGSAWPKGQDQN
jgi:hypothetical protein